MNYACYTSLRALGLGLMLGLGATSASAEPSAEQLEEARQYFENGQRMNDEGKYELAIQAWTKAYDISGYPELMYNISGALEKLGRYEQAIDALDKYRANAPATEWDTLDRKLRSLEKRIAESEPTPAPEPTVAPVPAPATTPPVVDSVAQKEKRGAPIGPIALISVGGAGLVTGGVFLAQAAGSKGKYQDLCVDGSSALLCQPEAKDSIDAYARQGTIGVAAASAGGALVITGAILLAVTGKHSSDFLITPVSTGRTNGLLLSGSFE